MYHRDFYVAPKPEQLPIETRLEEEAKLEGHEAYCDRRFAKSSCTGPASIFSSRVCPS